ncbi:aminotransferase class I/II-fold pyridoxal phosphate-dependent enzyme [Sneathiella litorea]|uniref:Aminotransferase class I/II-fold pyridoxal phosphate-dependent enzyme n=1 Tax=Sneathiella litorea TaxID=2606216 RepID=A0A6L8WCP7_9PROT|nr:aminotransferase class I/II-fold pyridoxal phosphate-dependent enzyme [Sneathiella litorea]
MKKFEEIAALIVRKIEDGEYQPGDRLPTHRDLAYEYGCSVGTASRAYAELERRGACYGRIGQGTFVYGTLKDEAAIGKGAIFPKESWNEGAYGLTDLSKNSYFHVDTESRLRDAAQRLLRRNEPGAYFSYHDSRGRPRDREVAERWLSTLVKPVERENIIITQGAQSGLYLAMATLAHAGETVATEALGYPGIRAAAYELDLKLAPVAMDQEGLIPEAFEDVCRRGNVKILVTVPSNHNPTGATQSLFRRERIIEIARRYSVTIAEDGVYVPLQNLGIPSYRDLAPDISIFLTTMSKVMSPALRLGYMIAPDNLVPRLATKMTTMNWMTSPLILDMANFLFQSGQVEEQGRLLVEICHRREKLAHDIIGHWLDRPLSPAHSPLSHLWIRLPEGQSMSGFVSSARRENIIVVAGDTFAMNRTVDVNHIRICLMAEPRDQILSKALERLAILLSQQNSPVMLI